MDTHKHLVFRGGKGWLSRNAILWDSFKTDDAAPVADPGTADPGPGLSTTVDTGNDFSITGGQLVMAGTNSTWGDPGRWLGRDNAGTPALQSTAAGTALFCDWVTPSDGIFIFGADDSATGALADPFISHPGGASVWQCGGPAGDVNVGTYTAGRNKMLIVQRADAGYYFYIVNGKLIWAEETRTRTGTFVAITAHSGLTASLLINDLALVALAAPWSGGDWTGGGSELSIANYHNASPSANDTDTSSADAVHQFKWTVAAAETLDMMIRRTDDTHAWIVRGDQAGSTVKIIEADGGETERASSAQTWTDTNEYDIRFHADGADVQVFVDRTSKGTYGSAASNQAATGTKVAGFASGADWNAWPHYPSLPAGLK